MAENYDISRNPSDLPKSKGVTSVRPGASRQHFLSFDSTPTVEENSHRQLTACSWYPEMTEEIKDEKDINELFTTELDPDIYDRYSMSKVLPAQSPIGPDGRETLKSVIDKHCNAFFEKALNSVDQHKNYEEALINVNKCIMLKPFHIPFYDLRSEIYLNLCDFQNSSLNLQKSLVYTYVTSTPSSNANNLSRLSNNDQLHQQNSISIPQTPANRDELFNHDKIAFLRFITGVTIYDQKLFLEALGIIGSGVNMFTTLPFQIYSILCLTALNKIDEACALVTQMIEQYPQTADLLIIRARLYFKDKTKLALCYYDVRDALQIDDGHIVANQMMDALEESAMQARDLCVRMSIAERVSDALPAINLAIQLYPIEAEFHLQRSIVYRKMKKFELATDECLLVLDKISHDQTNKLFEQVQKQFVFIYNECSIRCLQTGYQDEAVELLNRAISQEKNIPELYINRGDCFLIKGDVTFALQDYEQALELMPNNQEIKIRISNVYFGNAERQYKEKHYQDSCNELSKAIDVNPSIAKYYVSRSRVKYLTDDIEGAQEDIIAAILINPLEDGCIEVLPRLFADTTLAEVLRSSMTKYVKDRLIKQGIRLAIA